MTRYKSIKTFRLFSRPSFLEGVSRLVDFGNILSIYNRSETSTKADEVALASDWYAVGDDLRRAISVYRQTAHGEK